MRNISAIFKREFSAWFNSPIAYILLTLFVLIAGILMAFSLEAFSQYSHQFQYQSQQYQGLTRTHPPNINTLVMGGFFAALGFVLLMIMPMVTMRILAEEKKSGTIELLLTYPVKAYEVVLGKFMAMFSVVLVMAGLTLVYPIMIDRFGELNWTMVAVNYLGFLLTGAAYIALGMLFSSLTENQIIAAVSTFATLLLLWLLEPMKNMTTNETLGSFFAQLSISGHQVRFTKGLLHSGDLVYFATFIFFCIFLTLRTLDSNKWRT